MQVTIVYTDASARVLKSNRLLKTIVVPGSSGNLMSFKTFTMGSGARRMRFRIAPDFAHTFANELRGCITRMSGWAACPVCGRSGLGDILTHVTACSVTPASDPPSEPPSFAAPVVAPVTAAAAQLVTDAAEREYARVCADLQATREQLSRTSQASAALERGLRAVEACARHGDSAALEQCIQKAWREYDESTGVCELLD
jgi:hypothetical protein